jgi:ferric-dicitrate binding protein FerR (iron transport regulator)
VNLAGGKVQITGIAKGSGMIHPNMATMLGYFLTDAALSGTSAETLLKAAVDKSFNQMIVPFGKRSNIIFSDGSKVWLNSGSRLIYPPVFKGENREVFLEGEAYFEVAKNKNKPFIVRTSDFRIKVLGTRFNVQAYKNEGEQTTVLLEGKVNIAKGGSFFSKEYELSPNRKATLIDSEDNFKISEVADAENYIAWISGYLPMENQDILSLTKRISRYYNIDIEVTAKNVPTKFAGKLDLKEDPERIVEGLATIFKLKHRKEGEKIVIYE